MLCEWLEIDYQLLKIASIYVIIRSIVKPMGITYIISLLASFTVELLKFIWGCSLSDITVSSLVGVVIMLHFAKYVFVWAYNGAVALALAHTSRTFLYGVEL